MPISAKDIFEKKFDVARKGYDPEQVNEFLDKIIEDLKAREENEAKMRTQMDQLNNKVDKYVEIEDSLKDALITAQNAATALDKETRQKTAKMIEDAEQESVRITDDAKAKLLGLKNEYNMLFDNFHKMKNDITSAMEVHMRSLNEINIEKLDI